MDLHTINTLYNKLEKQKALFQEEATKMEVSLCLPSRVKYLKSLLSEMEDTVSDISTAAE